MSKKYESNMSQGYYLYPAIYKDTVLFVSEGHLWITKSSRSISNVLVNGLEEIRTPVISPDGQFVAFSANIDGGRELYTVSINSGKVKRLTYFGSNINVIGWINEGILFSCSHYRPFKEWNEIWIQSKSGGLARRIPVGLASFISFQDDIDSPSVIQRHGYREYSSWKRYRGGTAGEIWIDNKGDGFYKKLLDLKGYIERPFFIRNRIYFLSDHEGVGNIYSLLEDGSDLQRHTHHVDYYARNSNTDNLSIIYHAGGDLYILDLESNSYSVIPIIYKSSRSKRYGVYITDLSKNLETFEVHPNGKWIGVISRGIPFLLKGPSGPSLRIGKNQAIRYRFLRWLFNKRSILLVHDGDREDKIEIYEEGERLSNISDLGIGRIVEIKPNPCRMEAFVINHKNEIIHINLRNWKISFIDCSKFSIIFGSNWSPCGNWIAYSVSTSLKINSIKLWNSRNGKISQITNSISRDIEPSFDPNGKFLYFFSYRDFNQASETITSNIIFDQVSPYKMRPYLITLQKDHCHPFEIDPLKSYDDESYEGNKKEEVKKETIVDLDGIEHRITAFPISCGIYSSIVGLDNRVMYLSFKDYERDSGELLAYDFKSLTEKKIADDISSISLSDGYSWICCRSNSTLNIIPSNCPSLCQINPEIKEQRKTKSLFDLKRFQSSIDQTLEWEQIYREAWQLQRDNFWVEDMAKVDWNLIYDRYHKLLGKISTREELTDLLWEMQGELGTSHAYALKKEESNHENFDLGSLGAEFRWDSKNKAYTIFDLVHGEHWNSSESQPLFKPGLNLEKGDLLHQINGTPVCPELPPESFLIGQAEKNVEILVSNSDNKNKRRIVVKATRCGLSGRYRDWTEKNRNFVHKKTGRRSGYIHIPDMGSRGLSEFYRSYTKEFESDGLIIDVRFNSGGNISSFLLEKLSSKRIGYDWTRWFGILPYPSDSPSGPMVALINEYTGSDGDIFSHAFKVLKLGTLVGKRTWGGVIGILPRYHLVDGYITTQPEFSFWSREAGWSLENRGVWPDINVEITPQDYEKDYDPQLELAIKIILSLVEKKYPIFPSLDSRTDLKLSENPLKEELKEEQEKLPFFSLKD